MLYGERSKVDNEVIAPHRPTISLVVGSCLSCHRYYDFRAPENYVFLPDWMMKALGLRPRDTVKLRHVKLPGMFPYSTNTRAPMDHLDPDLHISTSLIPYLAPHPFSVSAVSLSVWRQTAAW